MKKDFVLKVREKVYKKGLEFYTQAKKLEPEHLSASIAHSRKHPKPNVDTWYDGLWEKKAAISADISILNRKANDLFRIADNLKGCDDLQAEVIVKKLSIDFPEILVEMVLE